MEYLQGIIKNITFTNEENAFAILKIEVTDSSFTQSLLNPEGEVWAVKGYLPDPKKGEHIRFFGHMEHHDTYGEQFNFERYEKIEGTNKAGLIDYLSSDLFQGIGPKTAKKIVANLGTEAIEKITKDKDVLDDIKGLSKKHKQTLKQALEAHKANEQTLIKLYGYGFSPKIAKRLIDAYGEDAAHKLKENPYQMIEDIEGIGFERADAIASNLGFLPNDHKRIKAVLLFLLETTAYQEGHTHQDEADFLKKAMDFLNRQESLVQKGEIETVLKTLQREKLVIKDQTYLTLHKFFKQEQALADMLLNRSQDATLIDQTKIQSIIQAFESKEDLSYTSRQKRAIIAAMQHKLTILTGGPGTGKTTVIKGIIATMQGYFKTKPSSIHLMAPTGRAAKRMEEATQQSASTIHKSLGFGYDGFFMHDEHHPIEGDLFIIDEASMIDLPLASHLFKCLPKTARIVLVGDDDQLPSVGPGQVLKDLIDSDIMHTTKLTTIHRQAHQSSIIQLANYIKQGNLPKHILQPKDDRYIINEAPKSFKDRLKRMVDYMMDKGYNLKDDIQILIPMYKGTVGIDEINDFMQRSYNQNQHKTLEYGDKKFLIDDKILQLQNRSEDGIMNGDQGRIIGIDSESETLYVDFFGKEITYPKKDLDQLTLAYAMSVHKAQGSEYPVVILPLFKSFSIMLKRRLIYTAITRAKEILIIAGDIDCLFDAVQKIEAPRLTGLKNKLKDPIKSREKTIEVALQSLKTKSEKTFIDDPDIPFDTLGENLQGKSPYDFMDES